MTVHEPLAVPPRDLAILLLVAAFDTLTRSQITAELFPNDDDGRITRKRLKILLGRGLLNQTSMQVVNPAVNGGVTAPVYYPSAKGLDFLRQERDDEAFRLVNATTPNWTTLYHSVAVAQTRLLLTRAAALRPDVKLVEHVGERAFRDHTATEPHARYRLFTLVTQEPLLVCKPDAGWLFEKDGVRKVFYLEQDRDSTKSAERVAAQKCGGYAGLLKHQLHMRHFPTATDETFRVLMIAPTPARRDALRRAVARKPEGNRWRFACLADLTTESFLTAPVWYRAEGDQPEPMVPGGPA